MLQNKRLARSLGALLTACCLLAAFACTPPVVPEVYQGDESLKELPAFAPENAPKEKKSPQDMPDIVPLWRPLNSIESSGAVRRRMETVRADLLISQDFYAFMPTGERTVLHGYLYRMQGQQRYVASRALDRAKTYLPAVKDGILAYGLPLELVAFPLVLSSYEAGGISSLGAAGLWQLTEATAREYGLKVDEAVDERLDPVKATGAAARYLKYLRSRFPDWQMVLLAYREGEGAVRRAIITADSHSYEELAGFCRAYSKHKYVLSEAALQNVPKFAAAWLVLTNSRALGLAEQDVVSIGATAASSLSETATVEYGREQAGALPVEPALLPEQNVADEALGKEAENILTEGTVTIQGHPDSIQSAPVAASDAKASRGQGGSRHKMQVTSEQDKPSKDEHPSNRDKENKAPKANDKGSCNQGFLVDLPISPAQTVLSVEPVK